MRALVGFLLVALIHGWSSNAIAGNKDAIAQTVETFLTERAAGAPGKVSIELGPIADSERYSTCQQWEAYLQEGVRPWGRLSVGVRCKLGANASLYVGAKVKITGRYLVAARGIPAGQTIEPADLKAVDGELSAQQPDLLIAEQEALGSVARSFIPAERPLRSSLLKQEMAILAGQPVRLITKGAGFTVSNEGQAVSSASLGQSVRVRLANGAILSGIAVDKGVVETK